MSNGNDERLVDKAAVLLILATLKIVEPSCLHSLCVEEA